LLEDLKPVAFNILSVVTLVSLLEGYSDSASALQHFSELKLQDVLKQSSGTTV